MNNQRRAALKKLIGQANDLAMEIQNLREQVEAIKDEEQEAFDNMPRAFRTATKAKLCRPRSTRSTALSRISTA